MRISLKQLNIQKTAERILFGWIFLILAGHILLAVFQHVIPYETYAPYILWGFLAFLAAAVLYVVFSLFLSAGSRTRILDALKKYFSFEQIILLVIFLWSLLSIYLNGKRAGYVNLYFMALDWFLFDTFLCMLVLFPLPRLLGKDLTKKAAELLIHLVTITYSVFTIVCLWHVFHLKDVDLPSGMQAGMTAENRLMFGLNSNTTGGITGTMFCFCVYMIVTQKNRPIRILYCIFGFFQLIATYLTNSRTPLVAIAIFLVFIAFWLTWQALEKKNPVLRMLISFAISALVFLLYWRARSWVFIAFNNITQIQKAAASQLAIKNSGYKPMLLAASRNSNIRAVPLASTYDENNARMVDGLSGRQNVWITCIRIMTSSKFNFFFGITPGNVSDTISTIGRFNKVMSHAHNVIFQMGVSFGVPVMAAYVVLILQLLIRCVSCLLNNKTRNKYSILLTGGILYFLGTNMVEVYPCFSVVNWLFYFFSGWIIELDDEIPTLAPAKKRAILKGTVSTFAYAVCIVALLLYADRYINLNPKRIPGSGTRLDPYLIEDKDDLCYFRDLVNHGNYFEKCYFLQTEDIDLQDTDWEPVGSWATGNSFEGIYDGSCHVIKNLTISLSHSNSRNEGRVALFGLLNGTVQNLGIESGSINGYRCGSIASISNYGAAIINCYNKASIIGSMRAGGICDHFNEGIVMNCLNEGILTAPVISELVSWDAKLVYGQTQEKDTTETFKGTFYPLLYQGETAQEKLNSGLNELLQKGIIGNNQISFW